MIFRASLRVTLAGCWKIRSSSCRQLDPALLASVDWAVGNLIPQVSRCDAIGNHMQSGSLAFWDTHCIPQKWLDAQNPQDVCCPPARTIDLLMVWLQQEHQRILEEKEWPLVNSLLGMRAGLQVSSISAAMTRFPQISCSNIAFWRINHYTTTKHVHVMLHNYTT